MLGRDDGDGGAGDGGIRTGRVPVGHGQRVLAQRRRLLSDAPWQRADDLVKSGAGMNRKQTVRNQL
jgi:hypothetical protein